MRLQSIEPQDLEGRSCIESSEVCYCLGDYLPLSRSGGLYAPMSSLVCNLKKTPNHRCTNYRGSAITQVVTCLSEVSNLEQFTIVPMPSSKLPCDPEYNPVLIEILEQLRQRNGGIQYLELIKNTTARQASHLSQIRTRVDELVESWEIDEGLVNQCKPYVMLFDDVLTSGAHYTAAKTMLMKRMPELTIKGLFIARTV